MIECRGKNGLAEEEKTGGFPHHASSTSTAIFAVSKGNNTTFFIKIDRSYPISSPLFSPTLWIPLLLLLPSSMDIGTLQENGNSQSGVLRIRICSQCPREIDRKDKPSSSRSRSKVPEGGYTPIYPPPYHPSIHSI